MKNSFFSLIALLWFNFSQNLMADVFSDPMMSKIRQAHDSAITGNKQDVLKAEELMNEAIAKNPSNQLYRVYLGSLLTIKSSKAFPGPSKLHFLKTGLATMDAAVEADPTNAAVRFVRAINNYMLPRFINRRDNAKKDFRILVEAIEKPQTAYQLDTQTLQAIYYYAGLIFKDDRDRQLAAETWKKGCSLDTHTEIGLKIAAELKKISG